MNRKKLFTVILTGVTAFMLLVGCGSDADNNKEDSTSADIQSEAAGTDTEDSAKAEDTPDTENPGNVIGNGKTLVVYYSASGNTERVAGVIADAAGADIFKVEPTEPYSDDDLDWTDEDSRVSVEHENENEREVELVSTAVDNWDSYDTVFVGYPIWWGIAAWPLDGFVKANDFTGKTVIPFCTSSSSDLGDSGKLLADMAGTGEWQAGQRFQSSASEDEIQKWVQGLGIQSDKADSAGTSGGNILIAYFSVPEDINISGIDADAGASVVVKDGKKLGNVQYMAETIQNAVGGDLFRIETKQEYPLDHDPLVDQAADEQDENARPELSTHIENPDQYDTILLGYPNWWGDMPQALYMFLEEYDFSGKTIIPFCPHGGSGFSGTERTITELQPKAEVSSDGLSISRNDVAGSEAKVTEWAKGLGIFK